MNHEIKEWQSRKLILTEPYEMVGDFLSIESHSTGPGWPVEIVLPALEEIRNGQRKEFSFAGNAYMVDAGPETVKISLTIDFPFEEQDIPFDEFYKTLKVWAGVKWD